MPARRAGLLPKVAAAGAAALLCKQAVPSAFVAPRPATEVVRGRTAMGGFKEDFDAWRGTLTPEEKKLVQKQAQGEFNKKFRKSDEFKTDLPSDKIEAFGKILGKFLDTSEEGEKKATAIGDSDPDGLLYKGDQAKLDFSLKNNIVMIDRDADRRYQWAQIRTNLAAQKGERYPNPSPSEQSYFFKNTGDDHKQLVAIADKISEIAKKANPDSTLLEITPEDKSYQGKYHPEQLPEVLVNQLEELYFNMENWESFKKLSKEDQTEVKLKVGLERAKIWWNASAEVEADAMKMKAFYNSQKDDKSKTKADVLKEIHAALGEVAKQNGKSVPPLDEDFLADLSKMPAVEEHSFKHPWGTASKLYKSEAIDAFGYRYLLGVYETADEAKKAFAKWNAEYEQGRKDMETELEQWSKQESARMDADTYRQESIKSVLESGRAA